MTDKHGLDRKNNQIQVLMPCFNAAAYLSEALDSLLSQTHGNWQLLIIDDGSTDDSLNVIKQYANKDSRIIWRTRENLGLIKTLNELVVWSSAPLLARMDADDLSTSTRFEKQLAFLQQNPDVDMVGCWAQLFGNKQEVWHFRESDNNTRILSLFGHCCMLHASVIAKREVFETIPFNPDFTHVEDFVFLSDIITQTNFKFGNVREILYHYRMHANSVVQQHEEFRKSRYEQTVHRHLVGLGLHLTKSEYVDYWHFVKGKSADYEQLVRIGRLLNKIRYKLKALMPDEHHEIALRWLKYCTVNQHIELYLLCCADDFCFFEQKNILQQTQVPLQTDICTLADLHTSSWVLLGDGGFAESLIEACRQQGGRLPECILSNNPTAKKQLYGVPILAEGEYDYSRRDKLVFGTNVYQMSILQRISHLLVENQIVYDCSSAMWSEENSQYLQTCNEPDINSPYVIIIDINPAEHIENWLAKFVASIDAAGISVLVRHPLQQITNQQLLAAKRVFLWNGAIPLFEPIKQRLSKLTIDFDFMECGFFPQTQYFYIDRQGINNERTLAHDRLDWVTTSMRESVLNIRRKFFADYQSATQGDYIFVPLQLANDSNIQRNSRFKNGMQEFIDFIEDLYPNEDIIFKKHPKDPEHYSSVRGKFSVQDSRQLIWMAKRVHGINSTVLFEAALAGKSVIAEGECLLKHKFADTETVVAAMIATQHSIHGPFSNIIDGLKSGLIQPNKTHIQGVYE